MHHNNYDCLTESLIVIYGNKGALIGETLSTFGFTIIILTLLDLHVTLLNYVRVICADIGLHISVEHIELEFEL